MTKESSFKKVISGKGKLNLNLFLLAFVVLLFFVNAYNLALKQRPSIMHQWRQSDCLSFTKNYYEEGLDFFHPKLHFQANKDGSAVSEFPILNYTVACLWKIFGEHEFIYKLLEYFIFILSVFFLFNALLRSNATFLFSFFCASFFLTSPVLVYYGFNFIADVPALSLAIIAFCLLYYFYDTKAVKYFYWGLFVSTLAVLIKASAIMPFALLLFFSIIDIFNLNRLFKTEKLFAKKIIPVSFIILAILLIISWYKYAVYYNGDSNNGVFLLTVLPIWEMQEEAIISNFQSLFNNLFPVFLNRPMLFLFLSSVIFVFANLKKLSAFLKFSFVFATLFFVFYILFFFQVFTVHDYYLNNLMILPVITSICIAHIVFNNEFNWVGNKKFFTAFVIIVIVFNSFYSAAFFRLRTIRNDSMCSWYPFLSKEEKDYMAFLRWSYGNSTKPLETILPDLRKAGIDRKDRVLSIPDESFNITLYLMDQKGLTLGEKRFADSNLVKRFILEENLKYVVVNNPTIKNITSFKVITDNYNFLLKKEHVEVYKRKDLQ